MPRHADAGGGRLESASSAAGVVVGGVLAVVAAVRGGKPVHPAGAAFEARLRVAGAGAAPHAATLLSRPGDHRAVVRFSRSFDLARWMADLLGISIRIVDTYGVGRHQDFLVVSSADIPVLHRVFLPARDVQQRPYSSSLPYRAGGEVFLVGVLPRADSPRPSGRDELDRVRRAAATGELRFDLATAAPNGRFRAVAELHISAPLPAEADALRFNPFNSGRRAAAGGLPQRHATARVPAVPTRQATRAARAGLRTGRCRAAGRARCRRSNIGAGRRGRLPSAGGVSLVCGSLEEPLLAGPEHALAKHLGSRGGPRYATRRSAYPGSLPPAGHG
jgi:hypothetical protein